MSKQITPFELAEIVCCLLVDPSLLGELDSPEKYASFIKEIGQVVADHCGGDIIGVEPGDQDAANVNDDQQCPLLAVAPNKALPSLLENVWSLHDPSGWDPESAGESIELGEGMPESRRRNILVQLHSQFLEHHMARGIELLFEYTISDDKTTNGASPVQYRARHFHHGQSSIEFLDKEGKGCLGVVLGVNLGVPAVHFDIDGGESMLHIHKTSDGLVVCPGAECRFDLAPVDKYSYGRSGALLLK